MTTSPSSPTGSDDRTIFDHEAALAQTDGDEELFSHLADLLQSESAAALSRIAEHFADRNFDEVVRAAHKLKGSLAMLHASASASAALELEQSARNCSEAAVTDSLERLKEELARLMPVLMAVSR
jgi:HPt (histidine-containing phosphotransfer) domain-containing protein